MILSTTLKENNLQTKDIPSTAFYLLINCHAWHVCRSLAKASVECSIDCMAAAMEFEIDLEVDKIEKRKFPMRNANMQSFLQRSINKRVNRNSNK
ncbi:hypothetical protein T12_318 [Trichinella patagoniensis]|uniref:Uncharacterized protein n=1 Tax=Trichinella patagoniensis TaxID=990121 RepID=A0A0V1AEQ6_9BILA|nr:hypothetical protein T12_318 [Trichinella patagoniensis]